MYVIWSQEMDDRLREFDAASPPRALRLQAEAISKEFSVGLSKSALCGRRRRLGLSTPSVRVRTNGTRQRKAAAQASGIISRIRQVPKFNPAPKPTSDDTDRQIPIEQRRTIMSVGYGQCRWPVGDPCTADFFFCGAPQQERSTYCPDHHARAWRPPSSMARPYFFQQRWGAA